MRLCHLDHSICPLLYADGLCETPESYAKPFPGIAFDIVLGRGQSASITRLVAGLAGRKAVSGYGFALCTTSKDLNTHWMSIERQLSTAQRQKHTRYITAAAASFFILPIATIYNTIY